MKQVLLFFEDRESDILLNLLSEPNITIILVRFKHHGIFSNEYLEKTSKLHIFNIDIFLPPVLSAEIFSKWASVHNIQVDSYFNISEKAQYYIQEFLRNISIESLCYEQTLFVRDKVYMKKVFRENNIKTVDFDSIYSIDDCNSFIAIHGFPIIIKPRNSDSCRNISIIWNDIEMKSLCCDYSEGWLIEKYLSLASFEEFAVEVIVCNRMIIDYFITKYPSALILAITNSQKINGGISMRTVDSKMNSKVADILNKIASFFDVKNYVFHLEYFYDTKLDEIIVSEIGFRLGGGNIIKNHESAFGINYSSIIPLLSSGNLKHIIYLNNKYTGDILLPIKQGVVLNFTPISAIESIPYVTRVIYKYKIGDYISCEKTSFANFGSVYFEASSILKIEEAMRVVNNKFEIEIEEEV
jgi:hypothetical protein